MKIAELITPAQIVLDLRASSKRDALDKLARRAAAALGLDARAVLEALLAREVLGSTGMGEGAAIPHARLREVARPYALLARLKGAIDFDAIDGRPVDLVCLMLLPADAPGSEPLNALASVSRSLRDPARRIRLRRAGDAETLYRTLTSGSW